MELEAFRRGSRFSLYEKLATIGLVVLAVASPLYMERKPESDSDLEDEEQPINISVWLPLLLLLLILCIALSAYLDQSFAVFDRYWIHRVCGSSGGIFVTITVLILILKWKSSM
ncbi:uncharacterized protein LOC131657752 [Vicia villosa]|uniref:uncharacterized protein LOC131657752 n=1 Tax=Vicia villosa TaxID=3911 RepID=UPI00273CADA8|nr:uncharacterized protein LOC131657752 [Vicia villosa]